jgi:hypothetical protein
VLLHTAPDKFCYCLQLLVPPGFNKVILDAKKLLMAVRLRIEIRLVKPLPSQLAKVARNFSSFFTRLGRRASSKGSKYSGNAFLFSDLIAGESLHPTEMAALLRETARCKGYTSKSQRILDIPFGDLLQTFFASAPVLRQGDCRGGSGKSEQ